MTRRIPNLLPVFALIFAGCAVEVDPDPTGEVDAEEAPAALVEPSNRAELAKCDSSELGGFALGTAEDGTTTCGLFSRDRLINVSFDGVYEICTQVSHDEVGGLCADQYDCGGCMMTLERSADSWQLIGENDECGAHRTTIALDPVDVCPQAPSAGWFPNR